MLLILPAVATARREGPLVPGNFVVVRTVDSAFFHTQNLRGGKGILAAGHARLPAVPAVFHADAPVPFTPAQPAPVLDSDLGVWTLAKGASNLLYFADSAKSQGAGHFLVSSKGPRTKTDVAFLAGPLKGVSYQSDVVLAPSGAGTISATGADPSSGRYAMSGCWRSTRLGSWNQTWTLGDGSKETDAYRNHEDGTSSLQVSTSRGIALDLSFAVDRSGAGTVTGEADGLPAKVAWNPAGDGTVTWADGSRTEFEDFKFVPKL